MSLIIPSSTPFMQSPRPSTIMDRQRKAIDTLLQHQLLQLKIDGNHPDQICGFFAQLRCRDSTVLDQPVTEYIWKLASRRLDRHLKESGNMLAMLKRIETQKLWYKGRYYGGELILLEPEDLIQPLCCRYDSWKNLPHGHVNAYEAADQTMFARYPVYYRPSLHSPTIERYPHQPSTADGNWGYSPNYPGSSSSTRSCSTSTPSHQGTGYASEQSHLHTPLTSEVEAREPSLDAAPLVEDNVRIGASNFGCDVQAFAPESYDFSGLDPTRDGGNTSSDIDQENVYKSFDN